MCRFFVVFVFFFIFVLVVHLWLKYFGARSPKCGMHVIEQQAAFAQERGLFKAARPWHVLATLTGCTNKSSAFATLPKVSHVDTFISHSSACSSWKKALAICLHLNLDAAIASSNLACLIAALLLRLHAGSFAGIASSCQDWLNSAFMYCPMGLFLVTFFFGHMFSSKTFWFDCACINEANIAERVETIQAIPAFVANSEQMLVLWDTWLCLRVRFIFYLTIKTRWEIGDHVTSNLRHSRGAEVLKVICLWEDLTCVCVCVTLCT